MSKGNMFSLAIIICCCCVQSTGTPSSSSFTFILFCGSLNMGVDGQTQVLHKCSPGTTSKTPLGQSDRSSCRSASRTTHMFQTAPPFTHPFPHAGHPRSDSIFELGNCCTALAAKCSRAICEQLSQEMRIQLHILGQDHPASRCPANGTLEAIAIGGRPSLLGSF